MTSKKSVSRSAIAGRYCGPRSRRRSRSGLIELRNRAQYLPAMAERDTDFFEVMVGQIAQNAWINVVLGKALRVLPQAKCVEPVRNLLHGGPHCLCAA